MTFLGRVLDERFFAHRRRSTSAAGITTGLLALLLFEYRLVSLHVWDWNLLAVGATFVAVKLALMTYFYLTD